MILKNLAGSEVANIPKDVVVVLPTGATEQHGDYLPYGVDAFLAEAVAAGVEANLGDKTLLLPTLTIGASTKHRGHSGTLTVRPTLFSHIIREVLEPLVLDGFNRFYVLHGHDGNVAPAEVALRELKYDFPNLQLAHSLYWEGLGPALDNILKAKKRILPHAGEMETSMMLFLHPGLCRMERAKPDGLEPEAQLEGLVSDILETSESGGTGDPTLASSETGKACLQAAVTWVSEQIDALYQGVVFKAIFS